MTGPIIIASLFFDFRLLRDTRLRVLSTANKDRRQVTLPGSFSFVKE